MNLQVQGSYDLSLKCRQIKDLKAEEEHFAQAILVVEQI